MAENASKSCKITKFVVNGSQIVDFWYHIWYHYHTISERYGGLSSKEKRFEKLFRKPLRNNVPIEELAKVLDDYGFTWIKGNHHKFVHAKLDYHLSVPVKNGLVLACYIKNAYDAVK